MVIVLKTIGFMSPAASRLAFFFEGSEITNGFRPLSKSLKASKVPATPEPTIITSTFTLRS